MLVFYRVGAESQRTVIENYLS